MQDTQRHILQTLSYFDIFHYPLLKDEILQFHGQACNENDISKGLEELLANGTIFQLDGFYSLHNDIDLANRRRAGNQLAAEHLLIARKAARILSRFPYVRGLAISGSLSKNFSTRKADIDFFIITKAKRLWLARTFMHLFKKFTFLTGRQDWFCMNYYIDEEALEIEEKNIYTAIEVVTLLPVYGNEVIKNFIEANQWTKRYLPVHSINDKHTPGLRKRFLTSIIEAMFNNPAGEWLDSWCMRVTDKRWQKKVKQNKKNDKGFRVGMLVSKHFSKPNPEFFQKKVLDLYEGKIQQFNGSTIRRDVPGSCFPLLSMP